jgi:hypothetical protein
MPKISQTGHNLVLRGNTLLFVQRAQKAQLHFMFDMERQALAELSAHQWAEKAHGTAWRKKKAHLRGPLDSFAHSVDPQTGDTWFILFDQDFLSQVDASGALLGTVDLRDHYEMAHCVYAVAFEPPATLWLAFPTGQTVSRFSLAEQREVFRIGDYSFDEQDDDVLCYPEGLCLHDGKLTIANMGSGALVEVDTRTLDHRVLRTGLGDLWEYVCNDRFEVYRTGSEIFYEALSSGD